MDVNNYMQYIWFGIALIFIIAEFVTPTFSFFVWFASGAIVAGLIAYEGVVPPFIQMIVFIAIAVLLIVGTKPLQKKLIKTKDSTLDTKERILGKKVQVVEDINNYKEVGKVLLEGTFWGARSYNDEETYAKDDIVTVIDVSGIILIVKK